MICQNSKISLSNIPVVKNIENSKTELSNYMSEIKSHGNVSPVFDNQIDADALKTTSVHNVSLNDDEFFDKFEKEHGITLKEGSSFFKQFGGQELHLYNVNNLSTNSEYDLSKGQLVGYLDEYNNYRFDYYDENKDRVSFGLLAPQKDEPVDSATLKNIVLKGLEAVLEARKIEEGITGQDYKQYGGCGISFDPSTKSANLDKFSKDLKDGIFIIYKRINGVNNNNNDYEFKTLIKEIDEIINMNK